MRLLPIALGLPGTIGFPTAIAHHRSPHRQVTEVSYAGKNIIAYHPSHGNSAPTSRMDCFVDSLLVSRVSGAKRPVDDTWVHVWSRRPQSSYTGAVCRCPSKRLAVGCRNRSWGAAGWRAWRYSQGRTIKGLWGRGERAVSEMY